MNTRLKILSHGMVGALFAALMLVSEISHAGFLTTTFVSDNSRRGNMFDVHIFDDMTLNSFDINLATGLTKEIFVYYKSGTWVGFDTNASAWTLLGSSTVTSSGSNTPTFVDVADLFLPTGDYALFVTTDGSTAGAILYTNGTTTFSNANLAIDAGGGTAVPFVDAAIPNRIWNGTINYTLASVPEPGILPLMALGIAGMYRMNRKSHGRLKS